MNVDFVENYLTSIGMNTRYSIEKMACEVCGSSRLRTMAQSVHGPNGQKVGLPVAGCQECGHIFQMYRFEIKFYQDYYEKFYRFNLLGNASPDQDFFADQIKRGNHLYKNLSNWIPDQGQLLDVGCSAGGMMIPFAKRGWRVRGNDPDAGYVEYGKALGLQIEAVSAEDMSVDTPANLIIINGSLEHVHDANKVLEKCKAAAAPEGLLLIEGRALGYGIQQGFLTHNHRRYLTPTSIELLMLKHGWNPILTTDTPLCGPTRPGAVFVLARAGQPADDASFSALRKQGRDRLSSIYSPWFETQEAA